VRAPRLALAASGRGRHAAIAGFSVGGTARDG